MVGPAQTHDTDHRDDRDWRTRGACRFSDPDAFFPVAENGPEHDQAVADAKRICGRCPVRAECAAWAIKALPHGVAGGMTADERHHARHNQPTLTTTACARPRAGARAVASRRPSRTRSRRMEDGQAALAHGVARAEVATEFRVSRRTVDRWAADQRTAPTATATAGVVVSGGGRR